MTTIENAAMAVIEFWKQAGPKLWFAKDEGFDRRFREAFYTTHLQAARRELESWMQTPEGALALLLLMVLVKALLMLIYLSHPLLFNQFAPESFLVDQFSPMGFFDHQSLSLIFFFR